MGAESENRPFRLDGRVAVVTGAGRGIGRSIAKVFAGAGASMAIVTRGAEAGREAMRSIVSAGGRASLICADLGTREACDAAIASVTAEHGGIDILVHNAGIFPQVLIEDISDAQLEEVMAVNLKSAFWLTRAALPHLRRALHPGFSSPLPSPGRVSLCLGWRITPRPNPGSTALSAPPPWNLPATVLP